MSPVAFVPKNYELRKKSEGEKAEKKVFDMVALAGRDIPGIQIICFHGVRVIAGSPEAVSNGLTVFQHNAAPPSACDSTDKVRTCSPDV